MVPNVLPQGVVPFLPIVQYHTAKEANRSVVVRGRVAKKSSGCHVHRRNRAHRRPRRLAEGSQSRMKRIVLCIDRVRHFPRPALGRRVWLRTTLWCRTGDPCTPVHVRHFRKRLDRQRRSPPNGDCRRSLASSSRCYRVVVAATVATTIVVGQAATVVSIDLTLVLVGNRRHFSRERGSERTVHAYETTGVRARSRASLVFKQYSFRSSDLRNTRGGGE